MYRYQTMSLGTYFFLHMRGVLFTQRDANFDIIDQQANKQLFTT